MNLSSRVPAAERLMKAKATTLVHIYSVIASRMQANQAHRCRGLLHRIPMLSVSPRVVLAACMAATAVFAQGGPGDLKSFNRALSELTGAVAPSVVQVSTNGFAV